MNLTEFLEGRTAKQNAVSNWMKAHSELFRGHTRRVGKFLELDDVAVEILDKKYPRPAPVQVIEDTDALKRLSEAQETIIKLQAMLSEYKGIEARLEASQSVLEARQALLDDKEKQLESLKEQNHTLQNELGSYKKSLFGFYRKK